MTRKTHTLAKALFCLAMGAGLAATDAYATYAAKTKPNVILITADDYGNDVSSLYTAPYEVPALFSGSVIPPTPGLDDLAAQGVVFNNAWSMPACTATRGTWITGKLPSNTGISNPLAPGNTPPNTPTQLDISDPDLLPKRLKGAGYATAFIGKWHLTVQATPNPALDTEFRDDPNEAGFDFWAGTLYGLPVPDYYAWFQDINGVRQPPQTTFTLVENINQAVGWINQVPDDQPYFMHLSLAVPHFDFTPPLYDLPPIALVAPEVIAQVEEAFPDFVYPAAAGAGSTPDITTLAQRRAVFNALVSAMDTEISRLLTEANINLDETYVMFMGDNGTQGVFSPPTPGIDVVVEPFDQARSKGTLYRGGVEVPLIVAGPRAKTGLRSDALVNSADIYATILNLARVAPYRTAQGLSFRSALKGKRGKRRFNVAEIHNATPEAGGATTTGDPLAGRVVANQDYRLLARVAIDDNGEVICVPDDPAQTSYSPDCTEAPPVPGVPGVKNGQKQFVHEFYDIAADPTETDNLLADPLAMSRQQRRNFFRLCYAANVPSRVAQYYFTDQVCDPFSAFPEAGH